MSIHKTKLKEWQTIFDQMWSDKAGGLFRDSLWQDRASAIGMQNRQLGWEQYMIPHEAVFRGLIALFDEYVETGNNVTHRDLVDFQRRLSSTSAIGMRMPYRWEKLDFTHLTSGKPETPAVLAQAALTTKNADVPVHDNAALQWFASSAFGAIGTLSCLLCVAGIFGAIFAGIGRVLFYLRTGEWLSSGCDVALKMNYDTNGWCSLQTQWAGFNDIMNTVTRHFDVSVMLFMIGVLALAVPLILLWLVTRR